MPINQFDCYPGSSEQPFIHVEDCLAHVGENCPYENLESFARQLLDVENVPLVLARAFSNPELAAGQGLLRRDVHGYSNLPSTYSYLYEYVSILQLYSVNLSTDVLIRIDFTVALAIGSLKLFTLEKIRKPPGLWSQLLRAHVCCVSLAS